MPLCERWPTLGQRRYRVLPALALDGVRKLDAVRKGSGCVTYKKKKDIQ